MKTVIDHRLPTPSWYMYSITLCLRLSEHLERLEESEDQDDLCETVSSIWDTKAAPMKS